MLLAGDPPTIKAIHRLLMVVRAGERPVVLWIGAGVSSWAGYPLWPALADRFHSTYIRSVDSYDSERAAHLLGINQYPEFFSLCKGSDQSLYFRLLTATLAQPQPQSPVHRRFCHLLNGLHPIRVLTTNVDEALEPSLIGVQVIQRSNVERAAILLGNDESFFCKLHGTISDAKSIVFTKEDYASVLAAPDYLDFLRLTFNASSVIFVGYSLSDQYVIDALRLSDSTMKILGTGPHFLVTNQESRPEDLPDAIHTILYRSAPHEDHRSSLQIVDMIRSVHPIGKEEVVVPSDNRLDTMKADQHTESRSVQTRSAYYIADLYPPGKWTTSQSVVAAAPEGGSRNLVVGQGFDKDEVGGQASRALHDLAVALLCFDETYLPLSAIARVHNLIGSERFWYLHQEGALRFVHLPSTPTIIFQSERDQAGGDIGMATPGFLGEMRPWTADDVIESELRAMPGKEKEAEARFENLKASTVTLIQEGNDLATTARAALLHPRLQSLIGLSDAILPTSLPRWLAFPCLRLLHVIQAADACRSIGIPALKIPFGGERLVAAVIGAGQSAHSADEVAGYLVLQRATGDLGRALQANPSLFDLILRFRSTPIGRQLRLEVFAALEVSEGAELETAVNGGLREALSAHVLDRARDQLEQMMVPERLPVRPSRPAVWGDVAYADQSLRRWRRRARLMFQDYCESHNIGPYDRCPCGSQEKRKFCCEAALRD